LKSHIHDHHQEYVDRLNKLLDKVDESPKPLNPNELCELAKEIKFNAGGNINHEFYWESLAPISE